MYVFLMQIILLVFAANSQPQSPSLPLCDNNSVLDYATTLTVGDLLSQEQQNFARNRLRHLHPQGPTGGCGDRGAFAGRG